MHIFRTVRKDEAASAPVTGFGGALTSVILQSST
jgi:hypothetical protein